MLEEVAKQRPTEAECRDAVAVVAMEADSHMAAVSGVTARHRCVMMLCDDVKCGER